MTAKEYLSRVKILDDSIQAKLEQLQSLKDFSIRCTTIISGTPKGKPSGAINRRELNERILILEEEINAAVDTLVDMRSEVSNTISSLNNLDARRTLELRYLVYLSWADIALKLNYSERQIYRLHKDALKAIDEILNAEI